MKNCGAFNLIQNWRALGTRIKVSRLRRVSNSVIAVDDDTIKQAQYDKVKILTALRFFGKANDRGQTFVEFILVFVVLFAANTGVLSIYKSVWKDKYEYAKEHSKLVPTTTRGLALKLAGKMKGYVK
jgi:hypothetical protein